MIGKRKPSKYFLEISANFRKRTSFHVFGAKRIVRLFGVGRKNLLTRAKKENFVKMRKKGLQKQKSVVQ